MSRETRRTPRSVSSRGRAIVLAALGLAAAGLVAVAVLRPSAAVPSGSPWARLGTQDVHTLRFPGPGTETLLFGHHDGVLRSEDSGRSWAPLGFGEDAMGMATGSDGTIIVAGHLVFQESRDGGASWTAIDADLPSLDIHAFARSGRDPDRMWAYLAGGGVYESTDGGVTWSMAYEGDVIHLTALRADGVDVLLGVSPFEGLVRSMDGGRTWRGSGAPPASPVTSLAATTDGRIVILGGPDGLHRSDDGGASWRQILKAPTILAAAISDDGLTIAVVDEGTILYRSSDGGATWPGSG